MITFAGGFGWLVAGLLAGLVSAPHCAGMCGPLTAWACSGRRRRDRLPWIRYQGGRMLAYGMLGMVAGTLGATLAASISSRWVSVPLSLGLALALGWAAYRTWPRRRPVMAAAGAFGLVQIGAPAAPRSPGRAQRLVARIARALPDDPLLMGLLSCLLPCGALWAAVATAAAAATLWGGLLVMIGFSISTALGIFGVAWASKWLGQHRGVWAARTMALLLLTGALILTARPLAVLLDSGTVCHHCAAANPGDTADPAAH